MITRIELRNRVRVAHIEWEDAQVAAAAAHDRADADPDDETLAEAAEASDITAARAYHEYGTAVLRTELAEEEETT